MDTSTVAVSAPLDKTGFDPKDVYEILRKKNIHSLHHANTVATAKTFIQQKALLSRGYVERNGLYQTAQYTDDLDKQFGIWDFIFLDGLHLSSAFGKNYYGPFLFLLNTELLLSDDAGTVRITRQNPIRWYGSDKQAVLEKFCYTSLDEFDSDYAIKSSCPSCDNYRDANMMLMLEGKDGKLNLNPHLTAIEVDDPGKKYKNGEAVLDRIRDYLKPELDQIGVNYTGTVVDEKTEYYKSMYTRDRDCFFRLFGPRPEDMPN